MTTRSSLVAAACLWLACGGALADGAAEFAPPYDHRALGRAYSDIGVAIDQENFDRLERLHEAFLAPDARTRDGTWMVEVFQDAFDAGFRDAGVARLEQIFVDWKERKPDSGLRPIAEAFALQIRAKNARGWGCHVNGQKAARKAYESLLGRAAAIIRESENGGTRSPLWYTVALLVAGGQGRSRAELDAIFDEGAKRFPLYERLYAARMTFYMPEWGGDYEQVDRFVQQSVERTRAAEGRSFYAWLYLELAKYPLCERPFDESNVDWPAMKSSFEDMLARHPDVWNRNVFAAFACRARDADTTERLLVELGADASLGVWWTGVSNEKCYRMLRHPEPAPRIDVSLASK